MATIDPPYLPSLGRLVTFASQVAAAITEKMLEDTGVTRAQWVMLTALLREDSLTVNELARYLRVTDPAASRLIDRMQSKGLVARTPDPDDRRVVRVALTPAGESKRPLLGLFEDVNQTLMADLSLQERETLLGLLERVVATGEAALTEAVQTPAPGPPKYP